MEALLRGAHERRLLRVDNRCERRSTFSAWSRVPGLPLATGVRSLLEGDEAEAHVREVVGVFLRAFKP
jgi:TetR/AcrR family transcriptional repressor of mexJK operon